MKKIVIAFLPACVHPCGAKINPDRPNVLTLNFAQAKLQEADRKEDLPGFDKGEEWRTLRCCICGLDVIPTHIAGFQKIRADAIDIMKVESISALNELESKGWYFAGLVEIKMGFKYGLN